LVEPNHCELTGKPFQETGAMIKGAEQYSTQSKDDGKRERRRKLVFDIKT